MNVENDEVLKDDVFAIVLKSDESEVVGAIGIHAKTDMERHCSEIG